MQCDGATSTMIVIIPRSAIQSGGSVKHATHLPFRACSSCSHIGSNRELLAKWAAGWTAKYSDGVFPQRCWWRSVGTRLDRKDRRQRRGSRDVAQQREVDK